MEVPQELSCEGEGTSKALLQCAAQLSRSNQDSTNDNVELAVSQALSQVERHLLSLPKPISSAVVPFRLVRNAVFDIVQRSSQFTVTDLTACCKLYLILVKLVPIAYDESAFVAVLSLMTSNLKRPPSTDDVGATSCKRTKKRTTCLSKVALSSWQLLVDVTILQTFAENFGDIGQVTASGFATLLSASSTASERSVATSGLKLIARVANDSSSLRKFSFIYKALVPVVLSGLSSPVKRDLVNLLRFILTAEVSEREGSSRDGDNEVERMHACSPEEGNSDRSPLKGTLTAADEKNRLGIEMPPATSKVMDPKLQFVGFLHFCCANVPEKSDDRKTMLDVVSECVENLDSISRVEFVDTFPRLARHPRSTVRSFVCTVCVTSLSNSIKSEAHHKKVLTTVASVLHGRARDKISSVVAKAVTSLAEVIPMLEGSRSNELVEKLCGDSSYLESLSRDEKVSVRKAYVRLAGAIVRAVLMAPNASPFGKGTHENTCRAVIIGDWIESIRLRCADAMSSVRKIAVLELSMFESHLKERTSPKVQQMLINAWIQGILRRIEDDEVGCQELCVESFERIFVSSLGEEWKVNGKSTWADKSLRSDFIEFVLSSAGNEASSLSSIIQSIMRRVVKKSPPSLLCLKALENRILDGNPGMERGASNAFGAISLENLRYGTWGIFADCLCPSMASGVKSKLKGKQLYRKALSECSQSSGHVAAFFSECAAPQDQSNSISSLIEKLFRRSDWTDSFWRQSVRAVIDTIVGVDKLTGTIVLEHTEKALSKLDENGTELEQLTLLTIIGECCSKLQLTYPPPQSTLNFCVAMANVDVEATIVRATAVLTLGKVCLCEGSSFEGYSNAKTPTSLKIRSTAPLSPSFFEHFARSCTSIFIRELQDETPVPVRNNCILVLSDLCRRYTAIIEPYQTRIAARLSDPSEMIRCHVLGSLGSLLQEDYIKVRNGAVFFRIALSLLDNSAHVRALAKYILTRILHPKSHSLLSASIIELIFVLNGCRDNEKYNQFPELHIGLRSHTHRPGADLRKHFPYEVFLSTMSEDQILILSSRVCSEIITPVVDGKSNVNDEGMKGVLFDSLAVLQMIEEYQYSVPEIQDSGNSQIPPEQMATSGVRTTKAALLRKVRMGELRATLIPLLLELRGVLEADRSTILESLTNTLICILKPHRNHLEELISDPTLIAELSHELAKKTRAEGKSSTVVDNHVQSKRGTLLDTKTTIEDSKQDISGEEGGMLNVSVRLEARNMSTPAHVRSRQSGCGLISDSPLDQMLQSSPKLAVFARGIGRD